MRRTECGARPGQSSRELCLGRSEKSLRWWPDDFRTPTFSTWTVDRYLYGQFHALVLATLDVPSRQQVTIKNSLCATLASILDCPESEPGANAGEAFNQGSRLVLLILNYDCWRRAQVSWRAEPVSLKAGFRAWLLLRLPGKQPTIRFCDGIQPRLEALPYLPQSFNKIYFCPRSLLLGWSPLFRPLAQTRTGRPTPSPAKLLALDSLLCSYHCSRQLGLNWRERIDTRPTTLFSSSPSPPQLCHTHSLQPLPGNPHSALSTFVSKPVLSLLSSIIFRTLPAT